jgi:lysophospholipase L1-like esterase
VVAKIITFPNPNTTTNARIVPYNEAVGAMVENQTRAGEHVLIVDMQNALPPNQYNDTLHPNDDGYKAMAGLWYGGTAWANEASWIRKPVNVV